MRRHVLAFLFILPAFTVGATDLGGLKPPASRDSECSAAVPGQPCTMDDALGLGRVELHSGEYVLEEEDMRIPGVGFDFVWRRKYISRERVHDSVPGGGALRDIFTAMGYNWDFSYGISLRGELVMLRAENCQDACYTMAQGIRLWDGTARGDLFTQRCLQDLSGAIGCGAEWRRPQRFDVITEVEPADPNEPTDHGGYDLTLQDGAVWHFKINRREVYQGGAEGKVFDAYLESIVDRNGNTMTFVHEFGEPDTHGYRDAWLEGVVDTLGRLISIEREGGEGGFISKITDFSGREVSYTYYGSDEEGGPAHMLKTVRGPAVDGYPGGTGRTYTYEKNWPIRNLLTISDTDGHELLRNEYFTALTWESGVGSCPSVAPTPSVVVDRIRRQIIDGESIDYSYHRPFASWPPGSTGCYQPVRAVVRDRVGNVKVVDFNGWNLVTQERLYTGRANPTEPATLTPVDGGAIVFASNAPGSHEPACRQATDWSAGDPAFFETRYAYTSDALLAWVQHPRGNSEKHYYSHDVDFVAGDSCTVTQDSENRGWCYDSNGFQYMGSSCDGGRTRLLIRKVGPFGAVSDQTCLKEEIWYDVDQNIPPNGLDHVGNRMQPMYARDARGNGTQSGRDDRGNLIEAVRPQGAIEGYEYDGNATTGPGLVTAHDWPEDEQGRRQHDEFEYYDAQDCSLDPAKCPMVGYLEKSVANVGGFELTTRYDYDARGNVTRLESPDGTVVELGYDDRDRLLWKKAPVKLPNGLVVTYETRFAYDGHDNLVRTDVRNFDEEGNVVTGHEWLTTVLKFDRWKHAIAEFREVADVEDSFWEDVWETDDLDALVAAHGTDDRFVLTRRHFDGNGNLVKTEFGEATAGRQLRNVEVMQYDERGKLFRVTRAPHVAGEDANLSPSTSQLDYDANGNLIRALEGLEDATWPVPGQPSVDGPRMTQKSYDGFDRLVKEVDPAGTVRKYVRDENGNVVREEVTGPSNGCVSTCLAVATRTLDQLNRPSVETTFVFDPLEHATCPADLLADSKATVATTYSKRSQIASVMNPLQHETTTEYDTAGRVRLVTDPKGNTILTEYDDDSNAIRSTSTFISDRTADTRVRVTEAEHDALGRVVETTDAESHIQQAWHDSRGNVRRTVDGRGNVTRIEVDGLSRVVATHRELRDGGEAPGAVVGEVTTEQVWDASSRLVLQLDDNDNPTEYIYDPLGRRAATRMADGKVQYANHDVNDNVINSRDLNESELDYTYDAANRLLTRAVAEKGEGVVSSADLDTFEHDGRGRLILSSRHEGALLLAGAIVRHHDSRGLLLSEELDGAAITHVYDLAGNRIRTTYPGGRVISRLPDELGRLRDMYDGEELAESCDGDPRPETCLLHQDFFGPNLEFRDYGNGVTRERWVDAEGIAVSDTYWNTLTDSVIASRVYEHDAAHNLTRRDAGPITAIHVYDSLNRLVNSDRPFMPGDPVQYLLEGVGNRVEIQGGVEEGSYLLDGNDALMNQYTETPDGARTYDSNGNMRAWTPTSPAELARAFEYDVQNFMVRMTDEPGHGVDEVTYTYDALGRRIGKKHVSDGTLVRQVHYILDGDRVVEEQDEGGVTVATYVHGDRYVDDVVLMTRGATASWLLHDDQFSVIAATDFEADVVERYEYSDYGSPVFVNASGTEAFPSSAIGNPVLFVGLRYDQEATFYHARSRYMDPRVGRFTTRDPLGTWGDVASLGNSSTYAANNPATLVDPSGRFSHVPSPYSSPNFIGPRTSWVDDGGRPRGCLKGLDDESAVHKPEDKQGRIRRWWRKWSDAPKKAQDATEEAFSMDEEVAADEGGQDLINSAPEMAEYAESLGRRRGRWNAGVPPVAGIVSRGGAEVGKAAAEGGGTGRIARVLTGAGRRLGRASTALRSVFRRNSTLYRAVSEAEFDQLLSTGKFEAGANSLGGKWFAESADDAAKWGTQLEGAGNFRVIKVKIPKASGDELMRVDQLDGIGPARYGELDQLGGAYIKEVK